MLLGFAESVQRFNVEVESVPNQGIPANDDIAVHIEEMEGCIQSVSTYVQRAGECIWQFNQRTLRAVSQVYVCRLVFCRAKHGLVALVELI